MSEEEKLIFIEDLMNHMKASIKAAVPKMPAEWDGHELRQYITDHVSHFAGADLKGQRLREYNNEVLVRNL